MHFALLVVAHQIQQTRDRVEGFYLRKGGSTSLAFAALEEAYRFTVLFLWKQYHFPQKFVESTFCGKYFCGKYFCGKFFLWKERLTRDR